jgi:hypothetical protein
VKITAVETIPIQVPVEPRRATRGACDSRIISPFLLVKGETAATPGTCVEGYPCAILSPFFSEGDILAELLSFASGSVRPIKRSGSGIA